MSINDLDRPITLALQYVCIVWLKTFYHRLGTVELTQTEIMLIQNLNDRLDLKDIMSINTTIVNASSQRARQINHESSVTQVPETTWPRLRHAGPVFDPPPHTRVSIRNTAEIRANRAPVASSAEANEFDHLASASATPAISNRPA